MSRSDTGRLSLACRGLDSFPAHLVSEYSRIVTWLDLSQNKFSDLRSLAPFEKLHTLILDSNNITARTVFPVLPSLRVLWLNKNSVANIQIFLDHLVNSLPNLKELSLLNNDAAPSFFNGGTKQEHEDYRLYVISRLPKLKTLDMSPVTAQEREQANSVYGALKGL